MAVVSRQDSWAIPVIEGMAAGRTVLTSEFNGSSEAIVTGETGFVVRGAGDPRQVAALLDGPLADPSVRDAVGFRAADEAHRYDLGRFYPALVDVYERAARRRSERPMPVLEVRHRSSRAGPTREQATAERVVSDRRAPGRAQYLVFGKPEILEEDIAEVAAALRSGWIGSGPRTSQFEEDFRSYTRCGPCCGGQLVHSSPAPRVGGARASSPATR